MGWADVVILPCLSILAYTVVGLSSHLSSLPHGAVFRVSRVSFLALDLPSTSPTASYALKFFWDSAFLDTPLLKRRCLPSSSLASGRPLLLEEKLPSNFAENKTFPLCTRAGQTSVTVRKQEHFAPQPCKPLTLNLGFCV